MNFELGLSIFIALFNLYKTEWITDYDKDKESSFIIDLPSYKTLACSHPNGR